MHFLAYCLGYAEIEDYLIDTGCDDIPDLAARFNT